MGCVNVKGLKKGKGRKFPGQNDPRILSAETIFTVNEVEALAELFRTMSESIVPDGKLSMEEFKLALFGNSQKEHMFADRIFTVFDRRRKKGKLYFEDFIRSLSIFHPDTPLNDKIDFSFRMYDLNDNGVIEQEEVRQMLTTYLGAEVFGNIAAETVESIIEQTFLDADLNRDGVIDRDEWRAFVTKDPTVIKYMTLPHLKDVTTTFTDFVWNTVQEDGECETSATAEAQVAQQPAGGSTSAAPNVQHELCETSATAEARVVAQPAGGSTSAAPNVQYGGSTSAASAAQHVAQPAGGSTSAAPNVQYGGSTSAASAAQHVAQPAGGSTSAAPNVQYGGSTSAASAAQHVAQPAGGSTSAAPNVQHGSSTSAASAALHGGSGSGSAAAPVAQPRGSTSSVPREAQLA